MLRTRVAKEMHDRGWSRLAVLPLTVGAGATTVALELTWALLRQQGVRVTLVDLNFLEPSIARQLELDGCSPVTDQIKSGADLDALLVELPEQPGLRVLAPPRLSPIPPSFCKARASPVLWPRCSNGRAAITSSWICPRFWGRMSACRPCRWPSRS
ncbi:hypothetical protein QWZ10_18030 [Paracoccus cavernae]|uniref:Uncharacterized protein n=1 Tax=Paracoccus cavernae TaxID=1571207 RepID=A0ABT8DA58_9RHOB|nr:hypothetical protein [Paracoccus cavernae]